MLHTETDGLNLLAGWHRPNSHDKRKVPAWDKKLTKRIYVAKEVPLSKLRLSHHQAFHFA
jgi:hypothetical protein